jgi:kynurenine formamidase
VSDGSSSLTSADFDSLYHRVSNWGRWDGQAARGTLNYLTPDRVVAAARLVRSGASVSLSLAEDTERRPDNPTPSDHRMTDLGGDSSQSLQFIKDYIGSDFHNDGHTHLDALCHVSYQGRLFDGVPDTSANEDGAQVGNVGTIANGIVGRGVLLDIPRLRGVPWLDPGDTVGPGDLAAAEQAQGVRVEPGDILLVRTGHNRRLRELGPWDTTQAKSGLDPRASEFLADRHVAILGGDGNSDAAPSRTAGVSFPIHVLAINAMGLYLVDYLQLEDLAAECERIGRWEFLCVIAPLRVPAGTGSPVNPIAVF